MAVIIRLPTKFFITKYFCWGIQFQYVVVREKLIMIISTDSEVRVGEDV